MFAKFPVIPTASHTYQPCYSQFWLKHP